jgi:hypothetical protein
VVFGRYPWSARKSHRRAGAGRFQGDNGSLQADVRAYGEVGCAASAYVDGRPVVDLWWGEADDGSRRHDTLVMTMSATKGALALCAQTETLERFGGAGRFAAA